MIDPSSVLEGSLAGFIAHHATQLGEKQDAHHNELLEAINSIMTCVTDFDLWYRNTQAGHVDLKHYQVIYKSSTGIPYIPDSKGRTYIKVFFPTLTVVNVVSPGMLSFNETYQGWEQLDFPDGTSFLLDTSNTFAQLTVWEVCSNVPLKG